MTPETRKEIERLCRLNVGHTTTDSLAKAILLLLPPEEPPAPVEDDAAMALLRELSIISIRYDWEHYGLPITDNPGRDQLLAAVRKHLRPPMRLRIVPCESWGKHTLEVRTGEEWASLNTDYLSGIERMRDRLVAAGAVYEEE